MSNYIPISGSGQPVVKVGGTEYFTDAAKVSPGPKAANWVDRVSSPVSCSFAKSPHYVVIGTLNNSVSMFPFGVPKTSTVPNRLSPSQCISFTL